MCYREERSQHGEAAFLKEEWALLEAVAEWLGRIAERRRVIDVPVQSETNYRTLVEHLPQGLFMKDRESTYTTCNRKFANFWGREPEGILGRDDSALFPRKQPRNMWPKIGCFSGMQEGENSIAESPARKRKDGSGR